MKIALRWIEHYTEVKTHGLGSYTVADLHAMARAGDAFRMASLLPMDLGQEDLLAFRSSCKVYEAVTTHKRRAATALHPSSLAVLPEAPSHA